MAKVKQEKLHSSNGEKAMFAVMFAVFAAYAASVFFAMGWAFLQSLKVNREFFNDMLSLPSEWLFSNYSNAFRKIEYGGTNFFGMFFNSLWFSLGTAVLSVFMHCVTGYAFAKYKFKGKQIAFSFILFTITIPIVGALPSLYKISVSMGITDSPLYLITALGGFGGNFLIMYAFFESVDNAYAEAAQIDGAGRFFIFIRVYLPFAAGPFLALTILGFIGQWNNYETPILFLDRMPTLSSGLYRFSVKSRYESDIPTYYAGALMSTIPVIVLVSAFGGHIMKNMTIGGLKG